MTNNPPVQNRLERKKEETKQKIVKVAMELFINRGFEQITMEQIAEEADVARRTLYNHFPVKEEIVNEYVRQSFNEFIPEIHNRMNIAVDTRSRLKVAMTTVIEWTKKHEQFFEVYMVYRMQNLLQVSKDQNQRSGFNLLLKEIIETGQKEGDIRMDVPFEMLSYQINFINFLTISMALKLPDRKSVDRLITRSINLFLDGAGNR